MTLQLVVDNSKKVKAESAPTCRKNCELFDYITGECGINYRVNPDDPLVAKRCGEMVYIDSNEDNSIYIEPKAEESSNYLLTEDELVLEDDQTFFEFNGEKVNIIDSTYPIKPDYPANRDDATWYVSPDHAYGCWIVNKSKKPFVVVTDQQVEKGWNKNVYKSPFPLHDHKSSLPIASRMVWYVDEDGYGQYAIVHNGSIAMISSPKPDSWK